MNKVRQTSDYTDQISDQDCSEYEDNGSLKDNSINLCSLNIATSRRVSTKQSPYLKVFYEHYPVNVTVDSGAEISLIKASSTASHIGASIRKVIKVHCKQMGVTPLSIIGETDVLSSNSHRLILEALVVNDLLLTFSQEYRS